MTERRRHIVGYVGLAIQIAGLALGSFTDALWVALGLVVLGVAVIAAALFSRNV